MAEQFITTGQEICGANSETSSFSSAMDSLSSRENQCNVSMHWSIAPKKLNEPFVFVPPYPIRGGQDPDLVGLPLQQIDEAGNFPSYNCCGVIGDLSYNLAQSQELHLEQHQPFYGLASTQELQLEQQQQSSVTLQPLLTYNYDVGVYPNDKVATVDKTEDSSGCPSYSKVMPYKSYDPASRNFFVYYKDEFGDVKTNTYSAQRYGLSMAERLADRRLKELGVDIETSDATASSRHPSDNAYAFAVAENTTPSISYDKKRRVFIVSWKDATMADMSKHFSAQRFGMSVAEDLAKEFYQNLCGVSVELVKAEAPVQKAPLVNEKKPPQTAKKKKPIPSLKKKDSSRLSPKKYLSRRNRAGSRSGYACYVVQWTDEKGVSQSKTFPDLANDNQAESTARVFMDKLLLNCRAQGEVRLGMQFSAPSRSLARTRLASSNGNSSHNSSTKSSTGNDYFFVLTVKCRKASVGYFTSRKALVAKPIMHRKSVHGRILSRRSNVPRRGANCTEDISSSDSSHGVIYAAAKRLSKNECCKGRKDSGNSQAPLQGDKLRLGDEDNSTQPSTPGYEESATSVLSSSSACTASRWYVSYNYNDSIIQIPVARIRRLGREGGVTCTKYVIYRGKGGLTFRAHHRDG